MTDRVCVLHIGTHKTGTTLLQHFLQWNTAALQAAGLCFPSAGWYGVVPGQHAIAWELLDEGVGRETAQLIRELRENEARHAIISSEELSLLFDRPARLRELISLVEQAGYQVKVLAYVRPQPPFAESMYAERIKAKDIRPFSAFVDSVIDTGVLTVSGWRVAFRTSELLAPFAELVGDENVRVQAYPVPGDELTIFHDFLAALEHLLPGFVPARLRLEIHRTRMNDSLSFGHLLGNAFVSLLPHIGLPDDPEIFIAKHVPTLPRELFDSRFSLLTREEYARFLDVFAEDNRQVGARFGMSAPFLTERDIPDTADPRWAIAAVERPLLDTCLTQWLHESRESVVVNEV